MDANIYKKLAKARRMFYQENISKTGHNDYAGYDYFELSDILPVCIRICDEVGLAPVISFDSEVARMDVYDCEGDGQITITSPMGSVALKGCHEIQNIGALETYSRRYLWFSLFEVTEKDALDMTTGRDDYDSEGKSSPVAKEPPKRKANSNDSKKAEAKAEFNPSSVWNIVAKHFGFSSGASEDANEKARANAREYVARFGISKISDITEELAGKIVEGLSGPEGFADSLEF